MKHRPFHILILLSLFASFLGAGPVLAQGTIPPRPGPVPPGSEPPPPWNPKKDPRHAPQSIPLVDDLAMQSLTLGQPGLSYRYVTTFGQTGVAYTDDTTHLNYPWGLGVDGTSIWIGELSGNRAMKYTSAGVFQQQIGIAGMGYLAGTHLWEIADVGVDGGGNIWVVDAAASHVARFNSSGTLLSELGGLWTMGADNSHFGAPVSIAFDGSGNIYVSDGAPWWSTDAGNQRIQVFNSSRTYIATIGVTGVAGSDAWHFHGPRHIAIYGNQLFVADAGNNRVQIFDITNPGAPSFAGSLAPSGAAQLSNPSGVAADASYIYVADTNNNRVQIFNRATLAYVGTVGNDPIDGKKQFYNPSDVAVDTGGNLYVADFGNQRVQQFLPATGFPDGYTYGTKGSPYATDGAHYNEPSGIALGVDGSLFIAEDTGHRLLKSTAGGSPAWAIGTPGIKADWDLSNDRLDNPADVAVDPWGRVFVADRWHNRVQIYDAAGSWYIGSIGGLNCPGGVHVSLGGNPVVADTCNQTVKIYNPSLVLIATLGTPGVAGADNAHFNSPEDVAIDSNGLIYVSDQKNQRVQVYSPGGLYLRTLGVTGVCGADFAHLCQPDGLFVDSTDRLYVADTANSRVQVFDSSGAYLTTIGGSWGTASGQMRSPTGVAVDAAGNVYVADHDNHRIQKFARRVPGWSQMNLNGFGDRGNSEISAMAAFAGQLYAGTTNSNGAQLWRSSDGASWSAVMTGGFGDPGNVGIVHLFAVGAYLYAGTWNCASANCSTSNGGQIWRSLDGINWAPVVTGGFGDPLNAEIYRMAWFNNLLYAATWSWSPTHASEIRSSPDGTTWNFVVPNGFADINNWAVTSLEVSGGFLYAGTYNSVTGGQVWRCTICTGASTDWTKVGTAGFGDAGNLSISGLAALGGALYASTWHAAGAGAEVWRCTACDGNDWTQVMDNGRGNAATNGDGALESFNGQLYFVVDNRTTGTEVWRCTLCDGTDWDQVGFAGFGDSNNGLHADKTAVFNSRLFIGTNNAGNAGEIWAPPALPYPVVSSIKLANPAWTNASTVNFIVTFSENVTGVDLSDFSLAATGTLNGSALLALGGSGDTYIVWAATGAGTGWLRLDLLDNNSIVDEATGTKYLGGAGAGNGSFTTGDGYLIPAVATFTPTAAWDGWVLERGEKGNTGGTLNAKARTFSLGDDAFNQQYRAILSFDTSALPDTAVISSLTLQIMKAPLKGGRAFVKLGNSILVDVKNGDFGKPSLQLADFRTAPTMTAAMSIQNTPLAGGWYYASLGSTADMLINRTGDTQFRLRFAKDDNNNFSADFLTFYSGNSSVAASRPALIIVYYVP